MAGVLVGPVVRAGLAETASGGADLDETRSWANFLGACDIATDWEEVVTENRVLWRLTGNQSELPDQSWTPVRIPAKQIELDRGKSRDFMGPRFSSIIRTGLDVAR
ncbi:hypothetical protein B0H13DRAFT_1907480 [Mycena leptocephala]|nr:hypothetical protein B0H13DRAFT_1907480 [Mycena leptocephala]